MPPTIKKCLKCGKTDHLTKDCPELRGAGRPSFGGFVGYVMKATVEERDLRVYAAFSSLNAAECHGRVIMDSGASESMAGQLWLNAVQEEIYQQYGEDLVSVDPACQVEFTFANGEKDRSMG